MWQWLWRWGGVGVEAAGVEGISEMYGVLVRQLW